MKLKFEVEYDTEAGMFTTDCVTKGYNLEHSGSLYLRVMKEDRPWYGQIGVVHCMNPGLMIGTGEKWEGRYLNFSMDDPEKIKRVDKEVKDNTVIFKVNKVVDNRDDWSSTYYTDEGIFKLKFNMYEKRHNEYGEWILILNKNDVEKYRVKE